MMATGVASPRAHGQEMTSTDMPRAIAQPGSFPMNIQIRMVASDRAMTDGTKTAETLSAILAMGALVAAAS